MRFLWLLALIGLTALWRFLFHFTWLQSLALGWVGAIVFEFAIYILIELDKIKRHFKIDPYDDDE
jgi:FtsH-binding integral membrane protein